MRNNNNIIEGKEKEMSKIGILLIIISILNIFKNYKNNIIILISLELLLIGISIIFIHLSFYFDDLDSLLTSLFLLVISAAEASIGLTILVLTKYNLKKLNS